MLFDFLFGIYCDGLVFHWDDLYYLAFFILYGGTIYIEKEHLGPFDFEPYWGC